MGDLKAIQGTYRAILVVALFAGCVLPKELPAQGIVSSSAQRPDRDLLVQNSQQKVPSGASQETEKTEIRITLGEPKQVFQFHRPGSLGLFNIPDMHTAVLQQPDRSYLLWITGNIGPSAGAIARLSTKDFLHYDNAGPGTPTRAEPVLVPSCRTSSPASPKRRPNDRRPVNLDRGDQATPPSCLQNPDADYVGANSVMTASNGKDLLMFYEAGNKSIGNTAIGHGWEYNVIARARSTDNGLTWNRDDVVVSGTDPKPTDRTEVSQPGISEPGVVVADGYIYIFYQYVPNLVSAPDAPSVIQVARAPLSGDGASGTWTKYYQGAFSQPGIGGLGSPVVATGGGTECTRPVQVWPAFSTYLNAHILAFLCNEGWFLSTSMDMVTWAPATNFMPMKMWQPCQPMDWNYIFVTPGNSAGTIGQTGYVLYAHSDAKGLTCSNKFTPHMLSVRPFTFVRSPVGADK
jgi:hypothetical protein